MEILFAAQIKELENTAIHMLGIPVVVLMERAALAVVEECAGRKSKGSKVLVLAGRGNNGGDGLAAARLFHGAGFDVTVMMVSDKTPLSRHTSAQRQILKKMGVKVQDIRAGSNIPAFEAYGLILDALLGTGLNRPAEGIIAALIDKANKSGGWKVSIDIPSGLNTDSSHIIGETFLADMCVTFTRSKPAHHLYPAKAFCGEVIIREIGVPVDPGCSSLYSLTTENTPALPERQTFGHKNHYGHVAVIGGNAGKSGAAVLAAQAALRGGAGLVSCVLPKGLLSAVTPYPGLMSAFGTEGESFSEKDLDTVLSFLTPNMVIALGPGIGRKAENINFTKKLIQNTTQSIVIDADSLYALDDECLASLEGRAVLTPHIGEFAHMVQMTKDSVLQNRLALPAAYALRHKIYLMVKSAETVISVPGGRQYISEWGTPALSKGGSGDVLTGILAALLAQGYHYEDAMKLACRIQGEASTFAQQRRRSFSVTPGDIIEAIGMYDNHI